MKKGLVLNFSPNKTGSSETIAQKIYEELKKNYYLKKIDINGLKISSCKSCYSFCYKYGKCKIKDDMKTLYKHFENDDFFIFVTPVYFYHIPGYAKIMIDRCQPYWVRKYILKNFYPKQKTGVLVCIGATKGKKLFSGINLTMKYFFDIFNINFDKKYNLYLKNIETKNDLFRKEQKINKFILKLKQIIKKGNKNG